MAKHTNKLFASILAVSCAFVMGACDPVNALPTKYNDKILNGNFEVNGNKIGNIYDAISGDLDNEVLQIILDEIVKEKFGTYTEIMEAYNALPDTTKALKYVNEDHPEIFKGKDNTVSLERFKNFAADVDKRVNEAFYDLIKNSSYKDPITDMFSEEKLYKDLAQQLYDLGPEPANFEKFFITSNLKKEKALEALTKNHINVYTEANVAPAQHAEGYKVRGYIETKILPQILKDKLIEDYIYVNNFNVLGRAYAREVNFISVPYTTESRSFVKYVVDKYVKENIYEKAGKSFDIIDNAIRGFDGIDHVDGTYLLDTTGNYLTNWQKEYVTGYATTLGNLVNNELVTVHFNADDENYKGIFDTSADTTLYFYKFTELGATMDDYVKAIEAKDNELYATQEQKDALAKFQSKDTLAESLRDKIISLAESDHTTNDWFVKNGSMPDMPLKDRLFSNNIATNFDKFTLEHYSANEAECTLGNYRYKDGDNTKDELKKTPFARNIDGRIFVMPANPDAFNDNNENFVYDNDSSFTICEVLEAPNSPKLNKDGAGAYKHEDVVDELKIERFAREIAKILSTKSSYVEEAYTSYLNEFTFEFHDSSFKEHFESEYPDLDIWDD